MQATCKAANSHPKSTPTTAQNERAANIVSDNEIRIGLSVSVSGRFQLQGQQALNGILLWESCANAQGGISVNGGMRRSVRLIWRQPNQLYSSKCAPAHSERPHRCSPGTLFQQSDDSCSRDFGRVQEDTVELWRHLG